MTAIRTWVAGSRSPRGQGRRVTLRRYGAAAFAATSSAAQAATWPVSHPQVAGHFDLSAGQTPEDMALEPDGAVDVSFAKADQVARVTRGGQVQVLAQLPKTGSCPQLGFPVSAGIARAGDGAIYVVDCT